MAAPVLSSETPLEPLKNESLIHATPTGGIVLKYEIESTVEFIQQNKSAHRIIALQFPDELLSDSVPVFQALKTRLGDGHELYILADTTFGSCCVDEIAAEHVNADVVIHYGHACLSPTARLPVYYVFTKQNISVTHCVDALSQHLRDQAAALANITQLLLRCDVAYEWKMREIADALASQTKIPLSYTPPKKSCSTQTSVSSTHDQQPTPPPSACCTSANACSSSNPAQPSCGTGCCSTSSAPRRIIPESINDVDAEKLPEGTAVIWIGPSSLALTHLLMTNPAIPVIAYEPNETGDAGSVKPQHAGTNKLLMRRYAAVQRARDADVLGIVVGTLGIASYLPLVGRLRSLLRSHQKKVYTLSVGKPTPAKLANYQEIECFVLVACPENSLLLTSPDVGKEFYRTMVTPWEMEVALNHRGTSWEQGWRLGWSHMSAMDEDASQEEQQDGSSDDDVQFSAATGKLRTVRKYGKRPNAADLTEKVQSMALQTRPDSALEVAELMGSAAGERLQTLTYRGLDPRFGMDRPAQLEKGRSGMARGYNHEDVQ